MPSINQIVVWIIIGLLGGSLAGLIITRSAKASAFSAISVLAWSALLSAAWCSACSGFSPDSIGLPFRCEMLLPHLSDRCLSSQ